MLQKMQEIREMQEKLTLKHFEIDQMRMSHERCIRGQMQTWFSLRLQNSYGGSHHSLGAYREEPSTRH